MHSEPVAPVSRPPLLFTEPPIVSASAGPSACDGRVGLGAAAGARSRARAGARADRAGGAPKDGQTVTADPEVVIYAQRTLPGADQTAYTLTLNQRPIDPATAAATPARSAPASRSACPCMPSARARTA